MQRQVPKGNQGNGSRKGNWRGMGEVGHNNILNRGGNHGPAWIGDCAYLPRALTGDEPEPSCTAVVDVSNPKAPRFVKLLTSPGSINAVETIHAREGDGRKVLVAAA